MTMAKPATDGRSAGIGGHGRAVTDRRPRSRRAAGCGLRAPDRRTCGRMVRRWRPASVVAGASRRSAAGGLGAAPSAPAGSCRIRPRRIEVNGTRISRKTSIETRNPANRNRTPRNLPSWNHSVVPNRFRVSPSVAMNAPMAIRIVAGTRLWRRPANSARTAPGSDATRLTRIATGAMTRLNRNSSPGWFGIERVGQDAPLGHEHVRREDRAEDQREGAGDVHERRQQPELRAGTASPPAHRSPGRPRSRAPAASSSPSGRRSGRSPRRPRPPRAIGQRSLAK